MARHKQQPDERQNSRHDGRGPFPIEHTLPDVPGRRKVYVIQTFHWKSQDGGGWYADDGESIVAFSRRDSAERYLQQLRAGAGDREYGIFEIDLGRNESPNSDR
jgi:hypothetical protein